MSNVAQIYKRTEVIGRGKFGIVYKGIHRATRQVFAIKVLNLDTSEDEVKDVQQEIQFLARLKQVPNVTRYHGSYLNGTKLWIIMDYCAGGSLRTLLKPGKIEEKYVGVIVRELLIALQYIHKQNVIHRDIKAANVLISNEGRVQLCDFGVAAQLSSTSLRRNTMAGTPYWMAPEVIMEGTSYDVKADIWSLGITIYEIATGNPPYCDKEAIRAMQLITKSKPPRLDGKQYSALLKEIIALCLDENAEERLSAEELLKTKFVKFHKNSPTSLLKELISRYLLWREKKSSRESIIMNIDDEPEDNEIEVKWDFDSLSSNEYIMENDINVSNIMDSSQGEDYFNFDGSNDYDDGDDVFMTDYHGRMYTNAPGTINNTAGGLTSNITYNKNTVTQTTNVGSTLKANGTMSKPPKSLLQLFEERTEEENEDEGDSIIEDVPLPRIPSTMGMHPSTSTTSATPRVSTPIVEIEIPTMEDIESMPSSQQKEETKTRSRANTLVYSQSASVLETRKKLDPGMQRRPTLSSAVTSISQPSGVTQPALQRHVSANVLSGSSSAPAQPQTSSAPLAPPPILRATPSPKRETVTSSYSSPSKLNSVTSSPSKTNLSMKALTSPNNPSPLLQPLNGSYSNSSSSATSSHSVSNSTAPTTVSSKQTSVKRNHQNLRLQMPTPTSTTFPRLLHTNSNSEEQDENVNQFGVNVSNVPMAMTPLTEKPSNVGNDSLFMSSGAVSRRKPTISQQAAPPIPFLTQRASSTVSSQNSVEGNSAGTVSTSDHKVAILGMDLSVFMDMDGSPEKLQQEIIRLLNGIHGALGNLEEKLIALNE
jgi:protein-serine/threonine kinase